MQVSRDTILSLLTVVLGVVLYHRQALTRTRTLAPTLPLTLTRFDKMLPELKAQIKKGEEYANQ